MATSLAQVFLPHWYKYSKLLTPVGSCCNSCWSSNRIQRINEQASDLVFKLKGFRPKTEANGSTSTGGIDYSYDANGNQTSDPHKGITSIQYNYLNLPVLISYADGRKIEQRYDAAGTLVFPRWRKSATPAGQRYDAAGTRWRKCVCWYDVS